MCDGASGVFWQRENRGIYGLATWGLVMYVSAWVRLEVQLAWGNMGEACSSWEGRVLVGSTRDLSCSTRRHERPGRETGMALRQSANFYRWSLLVHRSHAW